MMALIPAAPDFSAPTFALFVNGHALNEDITGFVRMISYEHSLDLINEVKIT